MGKQILMDEQKAQRELEEFLNSELGEYSFEWTIKRKSDYDSAGEIHFDVEYINPRGDEHSIHIYYSIVSEDFYINMYEDVYRCVRTWDNSIKYFWINIAWR